MSELLCLLPSDLCEKFQDWQEYWDAHEDDIFHAFPDGARIGEDMDDFL